LSYSSRKIIASKGKKRSVYDFYDFVYPLQGWTGARKKVAPSSLNGTTPRYPPLGTPAYQRSDRK